MRFAAFFFFAFSSFHSLYGQQFVFSKQWDYRFGGLNTDVIVCFQHTSDGGYILGGYSYSDANGDKTEPNWNSSTSDFWVVKIDSIGHKQWDKRFGGTGSDALISIRQSGGDGYVVTGRSSSQANGNKSQNNWGSSDYWVVKIDVLGNKQWDKRFGGIYSDDPGDIIQTKDGGYLIGGGSDSPISGDKTENNRDTLNNYNDMWMVKIDSAGNKLWDKRYGGEKQDGLYRLWCTDDGGYLLGGASNSDIGGDKTQPCWGNYDLWVVKTDSLGNKEWDKRYGGIGNEAGTVLVSNQTGYLLSGSSTSGISGDKTESKQGYWIVAIDSVGSKIMDKTFEGGWAGRETQKTFDGGYLLSGYSAQDAIGDKSEDNLGANQVWIIKIDSNYNKQWDKTIFTTKDNLGYAIQTTDGCYAVAASTKSGIGGYKTQANWDGVDSTYDYWIMKFCMEEWNGIDDRQQTADNSKMQVQVYPNPFSSDLSIALKGEGIREATFTITNALGQMVYKKEETNLAPNYTKVLDLSPLAKGVYFITVLTNGETISKRVVKE